MHAFSELMKASEADLRGSLRTRGRHNVLREPTKHAVIKSKSGRSRTPVVPLSDDQDVLHCISKPSTSGSPRTAHRFIDTNRLALDVQTQ